ncbi:MAG TPA: hypothetical protein VF989_12640 [Polyangiaceae bacterium]
MTDRVALKLVRPYETEADYLASEAWTISRKSLLLLGQAPLPDGTGVRCQVTLRGGAKLIEAEGVAAGYIESRDDRPGGLKLKLLRMSPATQKLIQRALGARAKSATPASAPEHSAPEHSAPEHSAPRYSAPRHSAPAGASVSRAPNVELGSDRRARALGELGARRSVHVDVPANRDALLARLRQRDEGYA